MMKMKMMLIAAIAAMMTFAAVSAFADVDVYGNTITYESDGITVKYRFWYEEQKAEAMSVADSASAAAASADDFEPRYRTCAASDGKCTIRGCTFILR